MQTQQQTKVTKASASKKPSRRKPKVPLLVIPDDASDLQKEVAEICNSHAEEYDDGINGFIKDLHYGGCQSGLVGELVYSHDCREFFSRHMQDVFELYQDLAEELGQAPMPRDNQNLSADWFAWLAFEETAFSMAREQGYDE
jgi:hypothetical protein